MKVQKGGLGQAGGRGQRKFHKLKVNNVDHTQAKIARILNETSLIGSTGGPCGRNANKCHTE